VDVKPVVVRSLVHQEVDEEKMDVLGYDYIGGVAKYERECGVKFESECGVKYERKCVESYES
jgi:hypothetical protein